MSKASHYADCYYNRQIIMKGGLHYYITSDWEGKIKQN